MHFGFALELSDIDLWNEDLLDTHLDLLDTDIPVSILFVSIKSSRRLQSMSPRYLQDMSSRHLQDMSSRLFQDLSSRLLEDMSWRRLQDMSSRRLQYNNFPSFKTSSRSLQYVLQDVFKTYWKTKNYYAEDVLKICSRHVLKTSWTRLQDQQVFAGQLGFTEDVALLTWNFNFLTIYYR